MAGTQQALSPLLLWLFKGQMPTPQLVATQVNQRISKTAHIKELNQEIDTLKAELFATREKNGVYMPADLFQQREQVQANP